MCPVLGRGCGCECECGCGCGAIVATAATITPTAVMTVSIACSGNSSISNRPTSTVTGQLRITRKLAMQTKEKETPTAFTLKSHQNFLL